MNQPRLHLTVTMPNDLISLSEASELVGVSRPKMTELVRKGYLRAYENLFDRRVKLVSRAQVLALKPQRWEAAA